MKILSVLLFVIGMLALGRFNYRTSRRAARHLIDLYRDEKRL